MSMRGPFRRARASLLLSAAIVCGHVPDGHARSPVRSLAEIRQQNVVMQKWDLSCGAAALATLLTYDLGDPVSERSVAEAMLRRNDPLTVRVQGGFSLFDLQEYVQRRGYVADGYGEMSSRDLMGMLPAIVPIRIHGYNHFVVVRAIREDDVHFADPAYGTRRLSLAAFEHAWPSRVAFVVSRAAR
jgi:predicted double-glycine peptidase